jgi:hypothetical protein
MQWLVRRDYPLTPDMTVIVEIKTDSRTAYMKSTVLRKTQRL